ncbi:MAG: flippase-like domain-containing protein [Lachnospiraceae bacterium]|nr:flippase-like domain-containing protein [Lachnospiraceae bacterium]
MNKKKVFLNVVFLTAIFTVTVYSIFKGEDLREIIDSLHEANGAIWLIGAACVLIFILSESVIIHYLFRSLGTKSRLSHCCLYSFVGFFFSCVTPSASGGQPMQVYFMKKDNLSATVSTQILMVVTVAYKLVLVLWGLVILIFRPAIIMKHLNGVMGWCYLGIVLNIAFIVLIAFALFKSSLAEKMALAVIKALGKIKLVKNTDRLEKRLCSSMKTYRSVAEFYKTHRLVIVNVFLLTLVQRTVMFFVTYLVYLSFGLHGDSAVTVVGLQGMISLAADMLPLPGGMGISESLFMKIFEPIFGEITLPAMVVNRGLSYYTQLLVSAVMTVFAYFIIGRKSKAERKIK